LNGLAPEDVVVELLLGHPGPPHSHTTLLRRPLLVQDRTDNGAWLYVLDLTPELCGRIEYRFRVDPYHELLTHPFEMGMTIWL
jgi:starch phosphorylase